MANVFLGYRINSTNVFRIERILREAKENVHVAAMSEYHRMLSDEICEVVDDIATRRMERPQRRIFDVAVDRLNERVSLAECNATGTEYDLRAGVTVIPDKGYTYLMLSVSNMKLDEAFEKTGGIESYKVTEADQYNDAKTAAIAKWESLRKRCESEPPLLSAALTSRITPDPGLLTFDSPLVRAGIRARRNVLARRLNEYGGRREIKSEQLMRYLEEALAWLAGADGEAAVSADIEALLRILPEVTLELAMADPNAPAQPPAPTAPAEAADSGSEADAGSDSASAESGSDSPAEDRESDIPGDREAENA